MTPRRHRFLIDFQKILDRFLREAHQIGKGTSKDTKNTKLPMTPRRHRFLIDFQKIFLDFCAKRIPISFVPFVSLDVQKKHQIIREHRKTRKGRKGWDALRAEPTNKAGAEPNSFELCPARRRKTKVKSKKIF